MNVKPCHGCGALQEMQKYICTFLRGYKFLYVGPYLHMHVL